MHNAAEQFRTAILGAGLNAPEVIERDGKLHRFASGGKPGDHAGWYVFHNDDIPAGAFGDWRGGISQTWRADIGRRLSPQEEAAQKARIESIRREREAEDAKRKTDAQKRAVLIWAESRPCITHDYLTRKGIQPHGARLYGERLALPIRDTAGALHSLQLIDANGGKKFLSGGRKRGCFFDIGTPDGVLCIAEGFATGASIHESTGYAVAIAFDCGNLLPVAKALREKLPDVRMVVCADNDKR